MKSLVVGLLLGLCIIARAETAVQFPDLNLNQNVAFKKNVESAFGHVLNLKVNGVDMTADLSAENPMKKRQNAAVGLISSYTWNGGLTGKMNFVFNVSKANKAKLEAALKKANNPTIDVDIDYQIYAYDAKAKGFYIATKSFTMKELGRINKIAKDLPDFKNESLPLNCKVNKSDIAVDATASTQLSSPTTFAVHMTASPGGTKQQNVIYATSVDQYEQFHWGISNRP